ncbi:MAG TPA: NADH-quinone oxidoreductase subunit D [Candidatus Thermoplasmatota archaeon]|nr:NADH-quinone oxidoreductase subunit D [Candidatus Thermoplasmatota archaeon]
MTTPAITPDNVTLKTAPASAEFPPALARLATKSAAEKQRLVLLNVGPQHPSTHGVLRLRVLLDGEIVRGVDPVIGYLHRGVEKLWEDGSYLQGIPLTDRLDYAAAMHNNYAFVRACEVLGNVQVPEKAQYIRVLTAEIQRVASHLLWLGPFCLDSGAVTPFFWCMRDREGAIALLERLSGARLTYNWYRIGGVKNDLPPGFLDEAARYCDYMEERLKEYWNLLAENDIFVVRTKKVGVLPKRLAINYGCSGPMLRGSGVAYDQRKAHPYDVYGRMKFDVPVRTGGDAYDRFIVRMKEMTESIRIIRQCIAEMPATGDYVSPEVGEGARQHRFKAPPGEVYAAIEGGRGEYGCLVVSDGTSKPYRFKWRAPTLSNLAPLHDMVVGLKIPDLVVSLGSIDIILGDLDR